MIKDLVTNFLQLSKQLEIASSIEIESFQKWLAAKTMLGQKLVDEALIETAKRENLFLFVLPTTQASFAQFIRPDTQTKGMKCKNHVQKEGFAGGFLIDKEECFNQTLPVYFQIGNKILYVKKRDNFCEICVEADSKDELLECVVDDHKKIITSDLDLLMIAKIEEDEEIVFDEQLGFIAKNEKRIISALNQNFCELVKKALLIDNSHFRLVSHGSYNHFPKTKLEFIQFPLNLYCPDGQVYIIDGEESYEDSLDQLKEKLNLIQQKGYKISLHPSWKERLEARCQNYLN